MGSGSKDSSTPKACPCSVSSNESSLHITTHVDFRFDVPRARLAQGDPISYQSTVKISSNIMTGYISPPDQPPRVLA